MYHDHSQFCNARYDFLQESPVDLSQPAAPLKPRRETVAANSYLHDERARDGRMRDLTLAKPLSFAYGRLRLVNAVLAYRHWGPCDTDDGAAYLDLMMPYSVEIAHLDRSCGFDLAMRRFRYWMPRHVAEIGEDGVAAQWNDLSEMRSVAKAHNRAESAVGHVLWLPTADNIRDGLKLRRAERDAINALYPDRPPIRGVGVIDPLTVEEARERNRLRVEADRRTKGVKPQSSRTKTAERKALALKVGCSARTLDRHEKKGTLNAFLTEHGIDVEKLCERYIMKNDHAHIFDTAPNEASAHVEVMAMLAEIAADPYA